MDGWLCRGRPADAEKNELKPWQRKMWCIPPHANAEFVCAMEIVLEAFEPSEARRLLERLEIIHTPKHGSWLNIAEIELNVMARQCLDRRIPNKLTLQREIAAWESPRNSDETPVDWQFTTDEVAQLRHLVVTTKPPRTLPDPPPAPPARSDPRIVAGSGAIAPPCGPGKAAGWVAQLRHLGGTPAWIWPPARAGCRNVRGDTAGGLAYLTTC